MSAFRLRRRLVATCSASDELPPSVRHPPCKHVLRGPAPFACACRLPMYTDLNVRHRRYRPRAGRGPGRMVAQRHLRRSGCQEHCGVLDCVRGRRVGLPRNFGLRHAARLRCRSASSAVRRASTRSRPTTASLYAGACDRGSGTQPANTRPFQAGGQGALGHRHDHASRLRHGAGRGTSRRAT